MTEQPALEWLHAPHATSWFDEPRARPCAPRWEAAQAALAAQAAQLPTSGVCVTVTASNAELALAALDRDGVVVLQLDQADRLAAAGIHAAAAVGGGGTAPPPLARSAAARELVCSAAVLELVDAVLGRQVLRLDAAELLQRVRPQPDQPYVALPYVLGRCEPASAAAAGERTGYNYASDFCEHELGVDAALQVVQKLVQPSLDAHVSVESSRHRLVYCVWRITINKTHWVISE